TVTLDQPQTVGTLNIAAAKSYIVNGGGPLAFSSPGGAGLNVASGTHQISAPLTVNDNLTVATAAAGAGVTLAGPISGAGSILKTGPGSLTLAASNSYSGSTSILGGTLQIASPSALGNSFSIALNAG